jgi:quercetin dioxygenase-like cupin family protein
MTINVTSEQTGGAFSLMEYTVPPGMGPAPHIHSREAEIFYVLEGTFTFTSPRGTFEGEAGTLVHGPKGTPHGWRNSGATPARLLILVVPGGFEGFFAELGDKRPLEPAEPGSPRFAAFIERTITVGERYGITYFPPGPNPFSEHYRDARPHAVTQPGEGESLRSVGNHLNLLMTSEETDGAYALWESIILPGGGVPWHVHHNEDEAWYVLEGNITFTVENGEPLVATPGTLVYRPKERPHAFQNRSDRPARMLTLVTPGGLEEFFREIDGVTSIATIAAASARYGAEILPV